MIASLKISPFSFAKIAILLDAVPMSYRKNTEDLVYAHPLFIMKTNHLIDIKLLFFCL